MTEADLRNLVRPDRVHADVYTDPAIFALEMERIWRRAWIFVAHDSQVPEAGDFVTTRMGPEEVIVARHRDGKVHVLLNRCTHRGAKVCNEPSGRTGRFRCPYHGWAYTCDGALAGIPLAAGYPEDFDRKDPALALARPARVDSYRGFVFASMTDEGPDLKTFLGPAATIIDDLCDRAPEGRIEFVGGVHKHGFNGNWKLQVENLNDLAHPAFAHESSIAVASPEEEADDFTPDDIMKANGASNDWLDRAGVWGGPYGHSFMGGLPVERTISKAGHAAYVEAMRAHHGAARTEEILSVNRHQGIVYPSLSIQAAFQQVKVFHPVAVDRTEVHVYPTRLVGAPEEYHEVAVRFLNTVNAPSSLILGDDLEIYDRTQAALGGNAEPWVIFANGFGTDEPDNRGGLRGRGTSELPMRNQYAAWRHFMCGDPVDAPAGRSRDGIAQAGAAE